MLSLGSISSRKASGFYGALPAVSPIVLVDGPFFLSENATTTQVPSGAQSLTSRIRQSFSERSERERDEGANRGVGSISIVSERERERDRERRDQRERERERERERGVERRGSERERGGERRGSGRERDPEKRRSRRGSELEKGGERGERSERGLERDRIRKLEKEKEGQREGEKDGEGEGSIHHSSSKSISSLFERTRSRRAMNKAIRPDSQKLSFDNIYALDDGERNVHGVSPSNRSLISNTKKNSDRNSDKNSEKYDKYDKKINDRNDKNKEDNDRAYENRYENKQGRNEVKSFNTTSSNIPVDEYYVDRNASYENYHSDDNDSVSTWATGKLEEEEISVSDASVFTAPQYKFPPKKFDFKK